MIDLKKLSPSDRNMLANSRFGERLARDVPADWKRQLTMDTSLLKRLKERGVIESIEEDQLIDTDPGREK